MKNWIALVFKSFRDFLFPPGKLAKELEEMARAGKLHSLEESPEMKDGWIYPIFNYRNAFARELIWQIKYRKNEELIGAAGSVMLEAIVGILGEFEGMARFDLPILVPIPQSGKRHHERGFNQAQLLAEAILKADGNNNFSIDTKSLVKTKDTPAQTSLRRSKRLENLKDCFAVKNRQKIAGRNIILIDDVTTTGATLKEARSVLKEAGTKKIIAITLA